MISCCCSAAVCCAATVESVWLLLFGTVGPACLLPTLKPRALRSCRANFACCLLSSHERCAAARTFYLLLWVPFIAAQCTHRCGPSQVKFIYDHVFEPRTDNRMVYKTVASPIVQSALDGINGTVFACEGPPLRFTLPLQRVCGRCRHHDALPGRHPSARGPLHTCYVLLTLSPAMLAAFLLPSRWCDELGQDAHDDGHG